MAITYLSGQRLQGQYSPTWTDADGTAGTADGDWDSSNTSGSETWYNYDETNDEIDFYCIRNDATNTAITKSIISSNNGLGVAINTDKWVWKFKIDVDTFDLGDTQINVLLSSFNRTTASNNVEYASGDACGILFNNYGAAGNIRVGWGRDEMWRTNVDEEALSGGEVSAGDSLYFVVTRDGTSLKFDISKTAFGNTDIHTHTFTTDSDWATDTGSSAGVLDYMGCWTQGGTGNDNTIQGSVNTISIENTGVDEKATITDVPNGTIFDETDTYKIYQFDGTDWVERGTAI